MDSKTRLEITIPKRSGSLREAGNKEVPDAIRTTLYNPTVTYVTSSRGEGERRANKTSRELALGTKYKIQGASV